MSCSASDASGNTSSGTFEIRITDGVPPVLSWNSATLITVDQPYGANVSLDVTASDNMDETLQVVCNPAAGTFFSIGVHRVHCEAEDAQHNVGSIDREVTVVYAPPYAAAEAIVQSNFPEILDEGHQLLVPDGENLAIETPTIATSDVEMPDGSTRRVWSQGDFGYTDGTGAVRAYNTDFVPQASGGFQPKTVPYRVSLPEFYRSGMSWQMGNIGGIVAKPVAARSVKHSAQMLEDADHLLYPLVWSDTDVVVTSLANGISEHLVARSADAPRSFEWKLQHPASVSVGLVGSDLLFDGAGTSDDVMVPAPVAYDASARLLTARFVVTSESATQSVLRLEWGVGVGSGDIAWPVNIDPSFTRYVPSATQTPAELSAGISYRCGLAGTGVTLKLGSYTAAPLTLAVGARSVCSIPLPSGASWHSLNGSANWWMRDSEHMSIRDLGGVGVGPVSDDGDDLSSVIPGVNSAPTMKFTSFSWVPSGDVEIALSQAGAPVEFPVNASSTAGVNVTSTFFDGAEPQILGAVDGADVGADAATVVTSSELTASWSNVTDAGSGINQYRDLTACAYEAASTPADGKCTAQALRTKVVDWTDRTVNLTGLQLDVGSDYRICLNVADRVGLIGAVCTDGVRYEPPAVPTIHDVTVAPYTGSSQSVAISWSDSVGIGAQPAVAFDVCASATSIPVLDACLSPIARVSRPVMQFPVGAVVQSPVNDGQEIFGCARAVSSLGSVSAWSCAPTRVDRSAPMAPGLPALSGGDPNAPFNYVSLSAPFTVSWTPGFDIPLPGNSVAPVRHELCMAAFSTCTANSSRVAIPAGLNSWTGGILELNPQGSNQLCVRAVDLAGNTSPLSCMNVLPVPIPAAATNVTDGDVYMTDLDDYIASNSFVVQWTWQNFGFPMFGPSPTAFACLVARTDQDSSAMDGCGDKAISTGTVFAASTGRYDFGPAHLTVRGEYVACVSAVNSVGEHSTPACSDGFVVRGAMPVRTTNNFTDLLQSPSSIQLDLDHPETWPSLVIGTATPQEDPAGEGVQWCVTAQEQCDSDAIIPWTAAPFSSTDPYATITYDPAWMRPGMVIRYCLRILDSGGFPRQQDCSDGVTIGTDPMEVIQVRDGSDARLDMDFVLAEDGIEAAWDADTYYGGDIASYDWQVCSTSGATLEGGCTTPAASGTVSSLATSGLTAGIRPLGEPQWTRDATERNVKLESTNSLAPGDYALCVSARDAADRAHGPVCSDGFRVLSEYPTIDSVASGSTIDGNGEGLAGLLNLGEPLTIEWTPSGGTQTDVPVRWSVCSGAPCGATSTPVAEGESRDGRVVVNAPLTEGQTYYSCVTMPDAAPKCSKSVTAVKVGFPNRGCTTYDVHFGAIDCDGPNGPDGRDVQLMDGVEPDHLLGISAHGTTPPLIASRPDLDEIEQGDTYAVSFTRLQSAAVIGDEAYYEYLEICATRSCERPIRKGVAKRTYAAKNELTIDTSTVPIGTVLYTCRRFIDDSPFGPVQVRPEFSCSDGALVEAPGGGTVLGNGHSTTLNQSLRLRKQGSPYYVSGNYYVGTSDPDYFVGGNKPISLVVDPGVQFYFTEGSQLSIRPTGQLLARGTSEEPIEMRRAPGAPGKDDPYDIDPDVTFSGTDNRVSGVAVHGLQLLVQDGTTIRNSSFEGVVGSKGRLWFQHSPNANFGSDGLVESTRFTNGFGGVYVDHSASATIRSSRFETVPLSIRISSCPAPEIWSNLRVVHSQSRTVSSHFCRN